MRAVAGTLLEIDQSADQPEPLDGETAALSRAFAWWRDRV